jgi:hypothetical protein
MVETRFSCYAASPATFMCPQRPCKLLIIRGAHQNTEKTQDAGDIETSDIETIEERQEPAHQSGRALS